MLSRLALRKGWFRRQIGDLRGADPGKKHPLAASLWRPQFTQRSTYWSVSSMGHLDLDPGETVKERIERWEEAKATYFGPERDFKNYPAPTMPEHRPPVRLGFIPSRWFDAFYNKTGVTGPYMLLTGGFLFILSKELMVWDHALMETFFGVASVTLLCKYLGKKVNDYSDKYVWDMMEKYWYEPIREEIENSQDFIVEAEKCLTTLEGQHHLFQAKRENVDLQLEYVYRQRLAEVHQAVKKRLDYQVEKENAVKRFEQKHQVRWIIQNVMKSITPQQEKETLARCMQDLKAMSATAKV